MKKNNREFELVVADCDEGKRADLFISENIKDFSRTRVQTLCKNGCVFCNNETIKANRRVAGGDKITVVEPEPQVVCVIAEDIPVESVYEDAHLIVINKAPGLVVHPAPGNADGTLVNALMAKLKDISGIGGELRPGIVHRLDKDTSGLMVVAKDDITHRSLVEAIGARSVTRKYIAVVKGMIAENHGIVRAPIGRHPGDRKKMAVVEEHGKYAETEFFVRERFHDFTVVECHLKTGRTHQIRVHMSYIGHPIVGDGVYGLQRNRFGLKRQALHAFELAFLHPITHEHMVFSSKLWDDVEELIEKLRQESKNEKT